MYLGGRGARHDHGEGHWSVVRQLGHLLLPLIRPLLLLMHLPGGERVLPTCRIHLIAIRASERPY